MRSRGYNEWSTTVSTDQLDLEALTPNHLPLLQSLTETQVPPGLFSEEDCFSRHRWKQVQYLSNIFWRRWSKEYLPQLQIRQKWLRKRRNLTVSTDNSPCNTWPLGRVLNVRSDKKGIVRRVTVRTKSGILERPVDKLCLLLETEVSLSRTYTYLVLSVIVEPLLGTLRPSTTLF